MHRCTSRQRSESLPHKDPGPWRLLGSWPDCMAAKALAAALEPAMVLLAKREEAPAKLTSPATKLRADTQAHSGKARNGGTGRSKFALDPNPEHMFQAPAGGHVAALQETRVQASTDVSENMGRVRSRIPAAGLSDKKSEACQQCKRTCTQTKTRLLHRLAFFKQASPWACQSHPPEPEPRAPQAEHHAERPLTRPCPSTWRQRFLADLATGMSRKHKLFPGTSSKQGGSAR